MRPVIQRGAGGIRILLFAGTALSARAGQVDGQRVIDLPAGDIPLAATFEEVLRVGGREAKRWEAFTDITSVGFDSEGNLFIGDLGRAEGLRIVVVAPPVDW